MVLLLETGQADQVALVPAGGNPLDPGTMPLAQNPLGKVPALERPDGKSLFDSRVITRYLNDRAGARLYPAAPRLWDTLTIEATADGMLDAAILMVYEARIRPEDKRFDPWIEGQWAKIDRALDALNEHWIDHLGDTLDMAQIAVGCTLGYLDFRHASREWRKGRGELAAWYDAFSNRPSMKATVPVG